MKTTWPLLLVSILVGIFSTTSAIRAEDYKDSKFPSDEIIARNILQLMVHNIKKQGQRAENFKVNSILEKLDKGNDISRIFFCTTYTKFEPMMGRPLEEASCNNVDVFKLDTSVWIIELSGMFYGVIQKYQ